MIDAREAECLTRIRDWLIERYPGMDVTEDTFAYEVTVKASSPWVEVAAVLDGPVDARVPSRHDFAVWRNTGDVYLVVHGEVDEEPLIPWNAHPPAA